MPDVACDFDQDGNLISVGARAARVTPMGVVRRAPLALVARGDDGTNESSAPPHPLAARASSPKISAVAPRTSLAGATESWGEVDSRQARSSTSNVDDAEMLAPHSATLHAGYKTAPAPLPGPLGQPPQPGELMLDRARDALLTDFGKATLRDRYLL